MNLIMVLVKSCQVFGSIQTRGFQVQMINFRFVKTIPDNFYRVRKILHIKGVDFMIFEVKSIFSDA